MCVPGRRNIYIYIDFFGGVLLPKKILCKKVSTSHCVPIMSTPKLAKDGCIHLLNDELEKLQSITPLGALSINGIAALPGDPWMKGRCVWPLGIRKTQKQSQNTTGLG